MIICAWTGNAASGLLVVFTEGVAIYPMLKTFLSTCSGGRLQLHEKGITFNRCRCQSTKFTTVNELFAFRLRARPIKWKCVIFLKEFLNLLNSAIALKILCIFTLKDRLGKCHLPIPPNRCPLTHALMVIWPFKLCKFEWLPAVVALLLTNSYTVVVRVRHPNNFNWTNARHVFRGCCFDWIFWKEAQGFIVNDEPKLKGSSCCFLKKLRICLVTRFRLIYLSNFQGLIGLMAVS